MSGLGIRLYTDEDVDPEVATQLNRLGYDVLSSHAAGNVNKSLSDEWQLSCAALAGRAILTHNVGDFMMLDTVWKVAGRAHYGIIFCEQLSIGVLVRRVKLHLDTYDPGYHRNLILPLEA